MRKQCEACPHCSGRETVGAGSGGGGEGKKSEGEVEALPTTKTSQRKERGGALGAVQAPNASGAGRRSPERPPQTYLLTGLEMETHINKQQEGQDQVQDGKEGDLHRKKHKATSSESSTTIEPLQARKVQSTGPNGESIRAF